MLPSVRMNCPTISPPTPLAAFYTGFTPLDGDCAPRVPARSKHAEGGKCSPELRKMGPAENRERRGWKRHRIAIGIGAQLHMNPVLRWMGGRLATYLAQPIRGAQVATASLERLGAALKPGDVLLLEGNTRVSVAIKYLTQSTWSHAMFHIGDALGPPAPGDEPRVLVEADMLYGIRG